MTPPLFESSCWPPGVGQRVSTSSLDWLVDLAASAPQGACQQASTVRTHPPVYFSCYLLALPLCLLSSFGSVRARPFLPPQFHLPFNHGGICDQLCPAAGCCHSSGYRLRLPPRLLWLPPRPPGPPRSDGRADGGWRPRPWQRQQLWR